MTEVVTRLTYDTLTIKDAAEADRYLLANGINAMFPVSDDFASFYEPEAVESA